MAGEEKLSGSLLGKIQQLAEDALSGHDGYYKEMDRTPPRLEPYPCPACHLFRRENSGIKNACTTKNLLVCRQRISILRYRKKKIYYTCFTLLQGVYTEFGTASRDAKEYRVA